MAGDEVRLVAGDEVVRLLDEEVGVLWWFLGAASRRGEPGSPRRAVTWERLCDRGGRGFAPWLCDRVRPWLCDRGWSTLS